MGLSKKTSTVIAVSILILSLMLVQFQVSFPQNESAVRPKLSETDLTSSMEDEFIIEPINTPDIFENVEPNNNDINIAKSKITKVNLDQDGKPLKDFKPNEIDQDKKNKYKTHILTSEEVEKLKLDLGVRDENKNYNLLMNGLGTGFAPPSEEEWDAMVGNIEVVDEFEIISPQYLPAAIDLSTSVHFPPVRSQRSQGSCSAWATTYYTATYLQSIDQGWNQTSSGNNSQILSPAWTYNKVNHGKDTGSHTWTNFYLLATVGGATWESMPYNDKDCISWGTEPAWREAPEFRFQNYSWTDPENIDIIKSWVADGYPVPYALDSYEYSGNLGLNDDTLTAAEYNSNTYNHANTIVGYDDNKTVDGEAGAFKCVNSWGSAWGAAWKMYGYYWMTYKAFAELNYPAIMIYDKIDYEPSLLATWEFNGTCSRTAELELGIGSTSNPIDTREPYVDAGSYPYPEFMCLDISEFIDYAGLTNFYLQVSSGSNNGSVSSFKLELYENSYIISNPTIISDESPDVKKTNPCSVYNSLSGYRIKISNPEETGWYSGIIQANGPVDDRTSNTILTEDFEDIFPGDWIVGDSNSLMGLDYWGNSSKKPKSGFRSGWCAGVQEPIFKEDFNTGGTLPVNWTAYSEGKKGEPWFMTNDGSYQFLYDGDDYGAVADCNKTGIPKDITERLYMTSPFSATGYSQLLLEFLLDFKASGTGDSAEVLFANKSSYPNFQLLKKWTNSTVGLQKLDFSKAAGEAEVYLSFRYTGTSDYYMFVDDLVVTANGTIDGYDNSMSAYMYQKVDLKKFDQVELTYDYWLDSEANADSLFVIYYLNSQWYYFDEHNGSSSGWKSSVISIPKNATYIGFIFRSDSSANNYGGAFLDNIQLLGFTNLSNVDVRINSGSWNKAYVNGNWTYSINTASYSDGENTLSIRAKYGSFYSYDYGSFQIDNTPPNSFSPLASPATWTSNKQPTISFSTTDALSGLDHYELKIDSGTFSIRSSPYILPTQTDGAHTITVRAYDRAGNYRDGFVNVYIDASPPNVFTVTANPNGWTNDSSPVITFYSTDDHSGMNRYELKIDTGNFSTQVSPYSMPSQSDGVHNITVRAYDNASNYRDAWVKVYIDTVSPVSFTPISNPSEWTSNNQPQITFSTNDSTSGVDHYELKINNGSFDSETSPYTLPPQADGIHNVTVRSFDKAGNYIDGKVNVFIDTTPPDLFTPSASPSTWTNKTQPVVTFNTTDNVSGVDYYLLKIDSGSYTTQSSPYTLSTLTDGMHTITIRAVDYAGNYRESMVIVYIDTTAPNSFSVAAAPSSWTNNRSPIISFSAIDTLSGINRFELKIDSGSFSTRSSPYTLPNQTDGIHNITVRAYDNASNYDTIYVKVYIDTVEPLHFTPLANPGTWTNNKQPNITFSTYDSLSGMDYYQVSIDSGIFSNQTSPYTIPTQTDGVHNITIRAFDNAGNYREEYVNVYIDTTQPNIFTVTAIPGTWTNNSKPVITFSTTDNISGINRYEVKIDTGSFSQQNSPYTLPAQNDGIHNITVRAYDNSNNYRDSYVNVYIDTSSPNAFTPTANPSVWTINKQPQITFSTTDTNSGIDHYEVRIDSGTFTSQSSPYMIPQQLDGIHNVTVRAFDKAGNYIDGYVNVYIDSTKPNTFKPTANPSLWTNNTQPVVTFSTTDNTSGIDHYELKIDSGSFTTRSSPYTLSALTDGIHYVTVRAIDNAGNFRDEVVIVYIDTTPPSSFSVTANPSSWTYNKTPNITFSAIDTLSGINRFELKIDSGSFSTQTSPYTIPSQTDGVHKIIVRVYDNASNYKELSVNVYIDTTKPLPLTPKASPNSWTTNKQPVITFSTTDILSGLDYYQISIDNSTFSTQTSPYTLPTQTDGIHNITVRAVDKAGNYCNGYVFIYIDTTPPNAFTPTATPSNWTNNKNPVISFSTFDSVSGIQRYEVKIDSGTFSEQTSPYTLPSQNDGTHVITVRSYDHAGNYKIGVVNVYIDTVKPLAFKPTANPSSWSPITQPIITFSTNDALSGIDHYEISIDLGTFVTQSSPYKLPNQTNGIHNITVRAYDKAGNYIEGYVNVYIDTSLPYPFTPTATPAGWTNNTQPIITFFTTDSTSGIDYYMVRIDNGDFYNQTSPYKLPPLSNGIHTITVRAFNKAGKFIDGSVEVYIDIQAPNDFTPKVTPGTWSNVDPVLSFNTTDTPSGISHYEVKIGNGNFEIRTSPITLSNLSDGSHLIIVRAYDLAGNYIEKSVYAYIDKTSPNVITVQSSAQTWKSDSTPDITFSTTDQTSGVDHYEVKIDNGAFSTQTSPYTLPVQSDGVHTITVRAYDKAGNYRDAVVQIYIDTTSPVTFTPTASPSTWTSNTQPTVTFSTTDQTSGIDHYEVRIDTGSFTTQTSPYTLPVQTDGVHTITVRAYDKAGNYRDAVVQIYIDTTGPVAFTPTASPSTWTNNTQPTVTFSTTDQTSGVDHYEVKIDNGAFTTQTSPYTLPVQTDGVHTITVRAYDKAGNYRDAVVRVYIDITNPVAFTPSASTSTWTSNKQPTVTFSTTDQTSGIDHYEVKIDTGAFATQTSPYTLPVQTDGVHTITVRAYDKAGNYIDGTVYIFVDRTSPEQFNIITTPKDWTNNQNPSISFTAIDSTSGISYYQVKLDDGMFRVQSSPYKLPTLLEGIHIITVRVFDQAGNFRDSFVKIYIDTTPPEDFKPIAAPSGWSINPQPVIVFSTTDALSGVDHYEIKLDDGEFLEHTSPYRLPPQSEGKHTVIVRAYDNAGNYIEGLVEILIDLSPPEELDIWINNDDLETNSTKVTIKVSAIDTLSGLYQISFSSDGKAWSKWTIYTQESTYTLSPGDGDGEKVVYLRVMDLVGNIAEPVFDTIFLNASKSDQDINDDTDGDGHPNNEDIFPNDPHEWQDTDNDKIGDNSDFDDDNDGFTDEEELNAGTDPKDSESIPGSTKPDEDQVKGFETFNIIDWLLISILIILLFLIGLFILLRVKKREPKMPEFKEK